MSILPSVHLKAEFSLDGEKYEIEAFTIEFRQPVDYKKQPQHEIRGGQIMITLTQIADNNLYTWAKTSTLLKSGAVLFHTDIGMTVLKVEFENGYCIQMIRETGNGTGTKTNLIISSETIKLNGIEHLNHWA
jgi:hypothetical protein